MLVDYFVETINPQKIKGERYLNIEDRIEVKLHDTYLYKKVMYVVVDIEVINPLHIKAVCHETKIQ